MFIQLDTNHYVRARAISAVQIAGHRFTRLPDNRFATTHWTYRVILRDAPQIDFETTETPDHLMARLNTALQAKPSKLLADIDRLAQAIALPTT